MTEELDEEPLHVCVCCSREAPRYVAHCLEPNLIGDGGTRDEAISRLKKTVEIQYCLCEARDIPFWADDTDGQWIQCHGAATLGSPVETTFVIHKLRKNSDVRTIRARMVIDKTPRIFANKDGWPSEYPLHKLKEILSSIRISWHISEELGYGYFLGHWPAGSDGPLQSYPFYAPSDAAVRWYHLRNIASRFWMDDLKSRLFRDIEEVGK